jgi:quinoprotein glucose dehydrogenase
MPVKESDICIIGGGISAAMLAQKLSELHPGIAIQVIEAGRSTFDLPGRFANRRREQLYGENPWPDDFIADQVGDGQISHTMALGGQALHWGGTCNRFSREDLELHSRYGLYTDWPIEWEDLERHYCEAERRLGVSGAPSSFAEDKPSQPYPMPAMPLSWTLEQYKAWGEKAGFPFQGVPRASAAAPVTSARRVRSTRPISPFKRC